MEPPDPTSAKYQDRGWVHVALFMLTFVTTTFWGALHYASFLDDFSGSTELPMPFPALFLRGFWYSISVLRSSPVTRWATISRADITTSTRRCRFSFRCQRSSPGTLGAFIRIREPIPRKRMLFDIGIAGPIAGFVVVVPALFIGIAMSRIVQIPPNTPGAILGEPLIFKLATWIFWGSPPDGYTLVMHPMAFAAWFGILATALNLFPIGQLDGGHITYAVLGRKSVWVTYVMLGVAVSLVYFSRSWIVWAVLTGAMVWRFGAQHPPVEDEAVRLDGARVALAILALAMFAVCFTPAPYSIVETLTP